MSSAPASTSAAAPTTPNGPGGIPARRGSLVSALPKRKSNGLLSDLRQRISKSMPTSPRSKRSGNTPALAAGVSSQNLRKQYRTSRVLGTGAGGTVHLVERKDHAVFAIKQFRPLRANESEKEYVKKITAEFCVGTTLQHINIIRTEDMFEHQGSYFQVLEYAQYDLFSVVMAGEMSKAEVYCIWRQIVDGVDYLHNLGLAHRDLKLDNCVMTKDNVVKIIDFGTAAVFRTPGTSRRLHASGIVGSDPYLAPEMLVKPSYDAAKADVFSLGVIFLCLWLRRFPWRLPCSERDKAFRLFVSEHPELIYGSSHHPTTSVPAKGGTNLTTSPTMQSATSPRWSRTRSDTATSYPSTAPTTHSHSDVTPTMKHTEPLTSVPEPQQPSQAHVPSALGLEIPLAQSPEQESAPFSPVPLEVHPTLYANVDGDSSELMQAAAQANAVPPARISTRSEAGYHPYDAVSPATGSPSAQRPTDLDQDDATAHPSSQSSLVDLVAEPVPDSAQIQLNMSIAQQSVQLHGHGRRPQPRSATLPSSPFRVTTPLPDVRSQTYDDPTPTVAPLALPPTRQTKSEDHAEHHPVQPSENDSIFSLCPPEVRPALRSMLAIEPTLRCTLGELLRGHRYADALSPLSYAPGLSSPWIPSNLVGSSTLPGASSSSSLRKNGPQSKSRTMLGSDEGDKWIKGIETCSACLSHGTQAGHTHAHPAPIPVQAPPAKMGRFTRK